MTAITTTDLANAKVDVDHIAAVANSTDPTATDRLGNTKQTLTGLLEDLSAATAITETGQNRAAAEAAADDAAAAQAAAEGAAQAANSSGRVFGSTALGIAGTSSGQTFAVYTSPYIIVYLNSAGVASEQFRFYAKAFFDALLESSFDHNDYLWGVFDSALRKLLAVKRDGALLVGRGELGGSFEHTDYLWGVLDSNRRVLLAIRKDGTLVGNVSLSEVVSARGGRAALADRLDAGLTQYGDPIGAYSQIWKLNQCRMRLRKLKLTESVQLVIALIGDSYTQGTTRFAGRYAKALQDAYGMAGVGWIGFGWAGTASGTWTAGSQPTLKDSSVRTDLVTTMEIIGTWACSYNTGSNNTPSLSKIRSSTANDYVRFTVPSGHDTARLFYTGDGTGVVQVSWNDGGAYSANVNLNTVGAASVALSGCTPGTARIKVISGNVDLAGVNLTHSTNSGVIVHKLGGSGSHTGQWVTVTPATWAAQLLQLGAHMHQILHGTNDQGQSTVPATFAANLETMFDSIDLALPYSDKFIVMPPENNRTTNTYTMPQYAAAAREYAVANEIAFCDLQYFFGSPDNYGAEYASTNAAKPWFSSDEVHPDTTYGGVAMTDALLTPLIPV